MRVLVACEFSGIVRDAFIARGHDAWSCDLLPTEKDGPHIQDDVCKHLNDGWDLMIGHPPCTYLANSGVRWLHEDLTRWKLMHRASDFFMTLWLSQIPKICIENPIPHRYARLPRYTQIIQPYQYGHPFSKATCLWSKCLPELKATAIVDNFVPLLRSNTGFGRRNGQKWSSGIVRDSRDASRTFSGIAQAMAAQWG